MVGDNLSTVGFYTVLEGNSKQEIIDQLMNLKQTYRLPYKIIVWNVKGSREECVIMTERQIRPANTTVKKVTKKISKKVTKK